MKVDSRILIGLGVVVVGIIVYIIIKSNKDKDDDDKNDDKEDNTKTNKARLDRLEKALTNAGIDTLEDFGESQKMTSTQEETGFTKSELFNIINQYFPTSLCVVEKLLDDGLMNVNNKIRTHYQLVENPEGKVEKRESEYTSDIENNMYLDNFDQNLLTRGLLISSFMVSSLIFALENDNLDNWYSTFIGIMSMMSLREEDSMFASYDEDHEDPYSTLVLYWQMGDGTSKNPEDYIEAGWLYDRPTNADGSRVQYIKFTPKIQFDRNKEKIEELKQFIVMVFYDYMVKCNSE